MADLSTAAAPLPSPKHNNPPTELEMLGEELATRHVHYLRDTDRHLEILDNIPEQFTEQLEADFIADVIKEIQLLQKSIENDRKEEKEPYLRKEKYVDSFFNGMRDKLQGVINKGNVPLTAWIVKKAAEEKAQRDAEAALLRQAAEHAAHQAEAAPTEATVERSETLSQAVQMAERVAAVPVHTMATVSGNFSSAGLREKWVGVVVDKAALDLNALRPYLTEAHLQVAINSFIKAGGRKLAGAKIEKQLETKVK